MNKDLASSHEYPDVEKIKDVHEQNFKGLAYNNQMAILNEATSAANI